MTGATPRLEHLIARVRQVGFPRIGAEMEICADDLLRSVLRNNNCKRKENKIGRGDCSGLSHWLSVAISHWPQPVPGEL